MLPPHGDYSGNSRMVLYKSINIMCNIKMSIKNIYNALCILGGKLIKIQL